MTVDARPQTLPFSIENAFTDRIEGGNPAAIVRIPSLTALPEPTLQSIAANFNQPVTVFVAPQAETQTPNDSDPPAGTGTAATFGIRWFTPQLELQLCGHGTLAAAGALFRSTNLKGVSAIRFVAHSGKVLVARQVEDTRVEIELDAERAEPLVGAEDTQMRGVLARALGKDVCVKYVGRGMTHLNTYALIEVDTRDLKGIKVDTEALVSSHLELAVCGTLLYGCLEIEGESVLCECRHRAIVGPWSNVRVEDVRASCRRPRGPCMWHCAHFGDALLDGNKGAVWGGQCEVGQFSWRGPEDTIRRDRTKD